VQKGGYIPGVTRNPQLASWLVARRAQIDSTVNARLGAAAPRAGAEETEVLRRFRSFASSALLRGDNAQPALDGIRCNERRVQALLVAWVEAAGEVAGPNAKLVNDALKPLLARFQSNLRTTTVGRSKSGAPRARRRAVMAAIDRVADAFLAVDAANARVVDANPAAGALLGVARDALLGVDAMGFVPNTLQDNWWVELDAMTEDSEPRRFRGELQDAHGTPISVECSVTRFSTRERTLALIMARPVA
jgi:PAS domain S-box-containing protein